MNISYTLWTNILLKFKNSRQSVRLHSPLQFFRFYSILKLRLILILKLFLHKNETKTRFLIYGKVITMSSFYCNYAATVFCIYCSSIYLYRRSKQKKILLPFTIYLDQPSIFFFALSQFYGEFKYKIYKKKGQNVFFRYLFSTFDY